MAGTTLHGPLLAQALARALGEPQPGAIAYVRCLTPDVVERLAADAGFEPEGWVVWRVTDREEDGLRTLTADRAVELREGKGDAMVLLVDTGRAGAGMDGIYSAGREVDEAGLFRAAWSLAAAAITKRKSAAARRYAEDALRAARRGAGGRDAVSPWTAFDYLCRVAVGEQPPGAYLNLIGLWPIRGGVEGFDHKAALNDSRRFVDRLLAAASLAPAARIESLRLDEESRQRHAQLARFLHAADAKQHLHDALNELAAQEELWVGSLRREVSPSIKAIELTPWRNRSGKVHRWSGLTEDDDAEGPPVLILGTDQDRQGATLEVRWKADPGDLERSAVDYRVVIRTSLDEELAVQDVPHSARPGGEKCRFSPDDFASLPDDAVQPAKVVVEVIGDQPGRIEPQESEDFVIRFDESPVPEPSVGKVERTFSEGLASLRSRDAVAEIATSPSLAAGSGSVGYVTLRTPVEQGRRRSFRVLRPSLIAEVEEDWATHDGRIGRWELKVRSSGERAGRARFRPLAGAGPAWERAGAANQLGREFPPLTYTAADAAGLIELEEAPRTVRGARDLLSVALQYGNAFGQGMQAAALKPADSFGDDNVLYLMEDMATGEIRLSILWEWLHKGAALTEDDPETGLRAGTRFNSELVERLLAEEYAKLQAARNRDVHDDSKRTTLPIARAIAEVYVRDETKPPWYIDLLNVNLDNHDLTEAQRRIDSYVDAFRRDGTRITENQDFA